MRHFNAAYVAIGLKRRSDAGSRSISASRRKFIAPEAVVFYPGSSSPCFPRHSPAPPLITGLQTEEPNRSASFRTP
jgi:hypothetical protein